MKTLVLIALISTFVGITHGHGLGQTLQVDVGDYSVDFDYDSLTADIPVGEATRFNFNLWKKGTTEPVVFTGAWVRIEPQQGYGIVFAGNLGVPEFGPVGMSYPFPRAGSYNLTVRFENKDTTLAEATFPLVVNPAEEPKTKTTRNMFMSAFVGLAFGALVTYLLMKKRRS